MTNRLPQFELYIDPVPSSTDEICQSFSVLKVFVKLLILGNMKFPLSIKLSGSLVGELLRQFVCKAKPAALGGKTP